MTNDFRSYSIIYIVCDRKNENHWPLLGIQTSNRANPGQKDKLKEQNFVLKTSFRFILCGLEHQSKMRNVRMPERI